MKENWLLLLQSTITSLIKNTRCLLIATETSNIFIMIYKDLLSLGPTLGHLTPMH